jgi:hypothetical protein
MAPTKHISRLGRRRSSMVVYETSFFKVLLKLGIAMIHEQPRHSVSGVRARTIS